MRAREYSKICARCFQVFHFSMQSAIYKNNVNHQMTSNRCVYYCVYVSSTPHVCRRHIESNDFKSAEFNLYNIKYTYTHFCEQTIIYLYMHKSKRKLHISVNKQDILSCGCKYIMRLMTWLKIFPAHLLQSILYHHDEVHLNLIYAYHVYLFQLANTLLKLVFNRFIPSTFTNIY